MTSLLILAAATAPAAPLQPLDSIRQAAQTFLSHQAQALGGDIDVDVDRLDPRLRVVRCDKPLTAFMPPGSRTLNTTTVGVQCTGSAPWTLYVPAHVTAYARVVVAVRPLAPGHRVAAGDVALRRQDTAALPMGYVTDPQQVMGQLVKRPIPMGGAVDARALAQPDVIHRGQQVMLVARSGSLEVRMLGEALMDGARGDLIRVRNLASNEVVSGTVAARGTVEVPL